jgi:hypothetical protein
VQSIRDSAARRAIEAMRRRDGPELRWLSQLAVWSRGGGYEGLGLANSGNMG